MDKILKMLILGIAYIALASAAMLGGYLMNYDVTVVVQG